MAALVPACIRVFLECDQAVRRSVLIHRISRQDKEFHFQNWFQDRLATLGLPFDPPARNAYPDFRLVSPPEGYQVKGLAYPGREANFDSNSQVPTGYHNHRAIYYLFGRYPGDAEDEDYPVIDFVLCHGDFLNANHDYTHENKNIKGFGSYGDIMIRDRKMYACPTPFALTEGTTGQRTLVAPTGFVDNPASLGLEEAGSLERIETPRLLAGYSFDLQTNALVVQHTNNPGAGKVHKFAAYRAAGTRGPAVKMRTVAGPRREGANEA